MKITTFSAPGWAKRTFSMVLATAMLFSALVFANTITASAYVNLVEPFPGALVSPSSGSLTTGFTFVVPETIYMRPAVQGQPTGAQYFMNTKQDGTAEKNVRLDTDNATKAKLYIGHASAIRYDLFFNGVATAVASKVCDFPGEMWNPTFDASNAMFNNTAGAYGANPALTMEWRVRITMDNASTVDVYNWSVRYHPLWFPSVQSLPLARGGRGTDANVLVWFNGMTANWIDGTTGNGGNSTQNPPNGPGNTNGRLMNYNQAPDGAHARILPLLGLVDPPFPAGGPNMYGSWTYGAAHNTTVGVPDRTWKGPTGNITHPDNDWRNSAGGMSTNGTADQPGGQHPLNSNANWPELRVDTSRHSYLYTIPNLGIGSRVTWSNGTTSTVNISGYGNYIAARGASYGEMKFIGYKGTQTTTAGIAGDIAMTVDLSENGFKTFKKSSESEAGNASVAFTGGDAAQTTATGVEVDRNKLLQLPFNSGYIIIGHSFEARTEQIADGDMLMRRTFFRIATPNDDKSTMRNRVYNSVWAGDTVSTNGNRTEVQNSIAILGNPGVAPVNTRPTLTSAGTQRPVPPIYYRVDQRYIMRENGTTTTTTTINGDGTAAPFSTPPAVPAGSGKRYTLSYTTTAPYPEVRGQRRYVFAVPAAETITGYTYSHSTMLDGTPLPVAMGLVANQTLLHYYDANRYFVAYDANGGTGAPIGTTTHYYNTMRAIQPCTYTKTGYTFDGWSTTPVGPHVVSNGIPVGVAGTGAATNVINLSAAQDATVTLYARWKANTSVVGFSGEGGSTPSPITVTYEKPYGALPTSTRTGYTFAGWWTSAVGGTRVLPSTIAIFTTGSYVLYAHWTPNNYEVTFDANGGTIPSMIRQTVTFDALYPALATTSRTGYTFDGWWTAPTGGLSTASPNLVAIPDNHWLYAHWIPSTAVVNFNSNGGGTAPGGQMVTYGENYDHHGALPAGPTPPDADHIFAGWFTAGTGGTQVTNTTQVLTVGSHTLFAQWTPLYPGVSFIVGVGADPLSPSYKDFVFNEPYGKLPIPTKTGYNFDGWYLNAGYIGAEVTHETIVANALPHKLYAKWEAKEINVMFDADGGTPAPADMTVTFDAAYGTLPAPTKTGYEALQWWTAKTGGTQVLNTTTVANDKSHMLYARWTVKTSTVTFVPNGSGATGPAPKGVTYGQDYGTLTPATRAGFDFAGWYTLPVGGSLVKDTTKVSEESDHSLYAHWTASIYEVRFNDPTGGGTPSPAKKNVEYLEKYGALATISRTGYDFAGWWTTASGAGDEITADSDVEITTITHPAGQDLYARWTPKDVAVTLDYNDGRPDGAIAAKHMATYAAATPGGLPATATRTGYDFDGWWTTAAGAAGREVLPGDTVTLYTAHTLYARWTGKTYEVMFQPELGDPPDPVSKDVVYGSKYGALATTGRTGYNFDGWYTLPFGGDLITAGSTVTTDAPHELWAHWSLKDIEVTFDANGGEMANEDPIIVTIGSAYGALPNPLTRDGYTFAGWYTAKTDGSLVTGGVTTVTNGNNHTLFAHWTPETYDVSFDPNYDGATWTAPDKPVEMGSRYGTLPVPARPGHTFAGWFLDEEDDDDRITARSTMETPRAHTLFAHWTEDTDVRVTLQFNNGVTRDKIITVTYDEPYPELPVPERKGFDFAGWFDAPTGGTKVIGETTPVTNRVAHTLYAYWTPMKIEVSFDATGGVLAGTSGNPITVTYGDAYGALPTPTFAGYFFKGWYTAATLGAKVEADTVMTKEIDHTLFARWVPDTVNVLFDENGGEAPSFDGKEVTMGGGYGALPAVSRPGYDFLGWYTAATGGTRVTPSTTVTNGALHSLFAQWEAHEITITYDYNYPPGRAAAQPADVIQTTFVGGNYRNPLPTTAPFLGITHMFNGWYTAQAGGDLVTANDPINKTESHTVYARWDANPDCIMVTWRDWNNATLDFTMVTPDEPYVLPSEDPVRDNYDFAGWYTARNMDGTGTVSAASGTQVTATTIVNNTNYVAHSLYAQYTPAKFEVTFVDPEGYATPPAPKDITFGEAYGTLPAMPKVSGYTFLGWFTSATGGTEVTAATMMTATSPRTLYARWEATTVEVTFNKNAANATEPVPASKIYSYGTTYGTLATVTRPGYDFAGWWTTGGERVYPGSVVAKQDGDELELFARWTPKEYVLTLDLNYTGKPAPQKMNVTYTGKYALPTPIRAGYDFAGWFDASTAGNEVKTDDTVATDADHTLYARWNAQDITVTFVSAATATITPATIKVLAGERYDKITALAAATRTGYNFAGWYTGATGGFLVTDATTVTNAANHSLYARWTAKEIEVSFVDDEFSKVVSPQPATFDAKYGALPVLTEPDYTFLGWYDAATGGSKVEASTIVKNAADHILYARWKDGIYNVLFEENGAVAAPVPAGTNVTLGETYGLDLNTARDSLSYPGYDFDGWWTTPAVGGMRVYAGTPVTNDEDPHTLYARWAPKTLTVTFDFNFTGKPADIKQNVTYLGNYPAAFPACDPPRPGYEIEGWYTLASGGAKVTAGAQVTATGNHTLYAHWEAVPFEVTFVAPDADTLDINSKEVTAELAYGTLAVAKREGYEDARWYTRAWGGTEITAATIVADDHDTPLQNTLLPHNLYAQWTPNEYDVTFGDLEHGLAPAATITVTFDAKYGALPAITAPVGFTFVGWYLEDDEDFENEITAKTDVKVAGDHVLYAHYEENLQTVTYDFNYPDTDPGENTEVRIIPGGQNYGYIDGVLPDELPELDLEGYAPLGWFTSRTGGSQVFFDTPLDPSRSTLYARWSGIPYDVTFDPNYDGLAPLATKPFIFGSKYGSALESVSRTGFDFDGWWTTDGTALVEDGVRITASTLVSIARDHALYARWTAKEYTLTFNGNGGAPDPTNKQVVYGSKYGTLATAERAGYNLIGWGTSPTGGTPVTAGDDMLMQRAHTLFAQWSPKKYTVTFNPNGGGAAPASMEVTFDAVYGPLPTVSLKGSSFAGWYTAAVGGTQVFANSKVTNPANHTLFARWNLATYGVVFDGNGGPAPYQTGKYVNFDQPYGELPVPEDGDYPGYTFIGWFTAPDGGKQVTKDTIVETGELHTLWAHWSPNNYQVTFFAEGGSAPSPAHKMVTFGQTYGDLAMTSRVGYELAGWWTTPLTGGTQVKPTTTMSTAMAHEVYARWDALIFRVDLDPNGGTVGRDFILVTYDGTFSALPVPSRTDYTFDGWFTENGVKVDPSDTVDLSGNITLTARWTEIVKVKNYLLTVEGGTGTGNYPAKTRVPIKAQAAPSGMVFIGWTLVKGSAAIDNAASESTTVTTGASDSTIKANFAKVVHCKCYKLHDHRIGRNHPHRLDHINNFWGRIGCFFCRLWHGILRWVFFGWIWM